VAGHSSGAGQARAEQPLPQQNSRRLEHLARTGSATTARNITTQKLIESVSKRRFPLDVSRQRKQCFLVCVS
jgi:hypothetical protein